MFCKECGKEIPKDSKFCCYCSFKQPEKLNVKFKELRLRKGLTQEKLAKLLDFSSKSSISNIERGRDIPIDKLPLIAKTLGTTEAYLMGWERDPEKIEYFIKSLRSITDEQFDLLLSELNDFIDYNSKNKEKDK